MFDVGEPRMIRGEMEPTEFSGIESGESDSIARKGGSGYLEVYDTGGEILYDGS